MELLACKFYFLLFVSTELGKVSCSGLLGLLHWCVLGNIAASLCMLTAHVAMRPWPRLQALSHTRECFELSCASLCAVVRLVVVQTLLEFAPLFGLFAQVLSTCSNFFLGWQVQGEALAKITRLLMWHSCSLAFFTLSCVLWGPRATPNPWIRLLVHVPVSHVFDILPMCPRLCVGA